MNKKQFLFLLPICLMFCIWFTTCEDEAVVTDLWDKLRNTVWTADRTLDSDGKIHVINQTIGFYGPNNGPFPQNYRPGDTGVYPYVVIRQIVSGDVPDWWTAGVYYFDNFSLQINQSGNVVSSVDEYISYNNSSYRYSYHISVSGNGENLTISKAKMHDVWTADRFNGTYTKVTSGPYNWGNGSGGGGTLTKPDLKEKFFGDYYAMLNPPTSGSIEDILIKEFVLSSSDRKNPEDHLYFSISDWEPAVTPIKYSSDYPNAFKIIGSIFSAYPQQNNPPSYLYGNKTAPGFTIDDITYSTECWMYLYFDDDGEELIRTAFSKDGYLNENVITETNNEPRFYRRR
jgi:hypothetical protein